MNVFLGNARARNGHVEATLNHPFPAQALVLLAAPFAATVQLLYIQACVDPPNQGKLAAALQIVGGVAIALGLAAGQLMWIQVKTDGDRGSRETRFDFAAAGAFYLAAAAALLMATFIWPVAKLDRSRIDPRDGDF